MERDMNQAMPTLCRGGCGFYGSSATEGLCSKCFKDTLKRKQDPGHISPTTSLAPKSMDAAGSRAFVAAVESLVTPPHQAGSSDDTTIGDSANASNEGIEKAEALVPSASAEDCATLAPDGPSEDTSPSASPQKQKNRCDNCRKRVGLTGFQCRCGGLFCAIHRYSDMHECTFDYKGLGEQEIRKNNPVVKTEKVLKL